MNETLKSHDFSLEAEVGLMATLDKHGPEGVTRQVTQAQQRALAAHKKNHEAHL